MEEEILVALRESSLTKAPGPDGFNAGWLKKMWHIISGKVMEFFQYFHYSASLLKGSNSSFVALIPKNHSPDSLNNFRPISLINCSIKLLLKVLANGLKPCRSKIISEEQTAFLKGRNITNSIFLVMRLYTP